jgi:peptidoglycan hydrolase-like amidase
MERLCRISLVTYLLLAQLAAAQEIRIGVLGLFHPHQLELRALPGQALVIQGANKILVLERSSGQDAATVTASGDQLTLQVDNQILKTSMIRAASRRDGPTDFTLSVPGKLGRRYHGILEVKSAAGVLVAVVRMDLETAVASAVQAESDSDTPLEALKAQAVATRSYFVATRGKHHDFDFCDTTHCQFLREPPPPDSDFARAAFATRGLILAFRDQVVAAMFARSCGGRTRTPQEVGMSNHGYPYFPVTCAYCLRNPWRWTRPISESEADDLNRRGEASRLDIDRRRGWDAVPSNNFTVRHEGGGVFLDGQGQGHGIGLCQHGAKAMAQTGGGFREILAHYYPNTTLSPFDAAREISAASTQTGKSVSALP